LSLEAAATSLLKKAAWFHQKKRFVPPDMPRPSAQSKCHAGRRGDRPLCSFFAVFAVFSHRSHLPLLSQGAQDFRRLGAMTRSTPCLACIEMNIEARRIPVSGGLRDGETPAVGREKQKKNQMQRSKEPP
jgi:hypothetical protein